MNWSEWGVERPEEIRRGQLVVQSDGKAYVAFLSTSELAGAEATGEAQRVDARPGLPSGDAVWVWDTEARLAQPSRDWIDFLEARGVRYVFLQAPRRPSAGFAELVASLRAKGVSVHALFGDRHDIFPEGRAALLEHVGLFAGAVDGLHFDIEPYLLPGFGGPRRDEILQLYLDTVRELTEWGHRAGKPVGFDIPSWFDQPPPFAGPEQALLLFQGARKAPYQHVLDMADNVALMGYRTRAERVLQISVAERDYASRLGKRLWLGVETTALPDETTWTFAGVPRHGQAEAGEVGLTADGVFRLGPLGDSGLVWKVVGSEVTPARALSFAGLPRERLETMRRELSPYPLAFHDLNGWMKLWER